MKVLRYFSTTMALLIASAVGGIATHWYGKEKKVPLVHKLSYPLMLAGAGSAEHSYLLPAGTSLYYDQAFPEGFVRYKVYVNVEGVKLDSHESNEKFWLDPLTAFPVAKPQLQKLLRDYPLTKNDLAEILKSGVLTKAEIRELLAEYSQ